MHGVLSEHYLTLIHDTNGLFSVKKAKLITSLGLLHNITFLLFTFNRH